MEDPKFIRKYRLILNSIINATTIININYIYIYILYLILSKI